MTSDRDGFIICVLASDPAFFADDAFGTCCKCGAAVRFRPYALDTGHTPICLPCGTPLLIEALARGDGVRLTDKARAEAELYFATSKGKA